MRIRISMGKEKNQPISPQLLLDASKMMDNDPTSSDEAQAKAVNTLAETKNYRTMTEMSNIEIGLLAALDSVYTEMDDSLGKAFVKNFALWKVSHERKGRGELASLARTMAEDRISKWTKLRSMLTGGV